MKTESYHSQKRHLRTPEANEPLDKHIFEQINLDLEWGLSAANTFTERDQEPPLDALLHGLRAIAGRWYHRFKEAEEKGNQPTAIEMQEFASFWYRLESEITELFNTKDPESNNRVQGTRRKRRVP